MPVDIEPGPTALDDFRTENDEREVQPLRYAISSYGADHPVDGLVKRIQKGDIYVPPFQRGFVWDIKDASRFVESLLLGLPVPGIFLSKEAGTNKLLVVDGQQRLLSLQYFYEGIWQPTQVVFVLKGVQQQFEGKKYNTLADDDRRRLDDAILHATIFQQDEPSDDESSVYQVFERLNSGGKRLSPQEIRSAVHHDSRLRSLLEELNQATAWRQLYGSGSEDPRMRDQELILRFLALLTNGETYESPMVTFLNQFMGGKKGLSATEEQAMKDTFTNVINLIHSSVGTRAFRPSRALNAAVFDAVMVGTARRLRNGEIRSLSDHTTAYDLLLENRSFLDSCGRGTASEERVQTRLRLATEAFAAVP
jgi:hypothetical protein